MLTRRKLLTKSSSDEEDDDGVIPQSAPGAQAPEIGHEEDLPPMQWADPDLAALPPPGRVCRSKNGCLGDLLTAVAALAAVLKEDDNDTPESCRKLSTIAASWARETEEMRPAQAAAILMSRRDKVPAKLDLPPKVPSQDRALKKRLPFIREFAAAGGDWEAFRRRFAAACDLSGWTEKEALRALPTALTDDALAAFDAIPDEDKSMLSQALAHLGAILLLHRTSARKSRDPQRDPEATPVRSPLLGEGGGGWVTRPWPASHFAGDRDLASPQSPVGWGRPRGGVRGPRGEAPMGPAAPRGPGGSRGGGRGGAGTPGGLRTNKGEVCFPGGKQDPQDQDETATALREALEEIGLPPDQVEVVCQLVPIINMRGLMVTSVVGFVPPDFEPKPNPDEVSAIFHMPLAHFLSPINHRDRKITAPGGSTFNIHYFTYQEAKSGEAEGPSYQIWGLTSIICIVVATIVLGRAPEFPVNFDVSNPQGFMEQYLNDRRIPNKL
ncbi:unnamed protein product [Lampetra planeri]